MVTPQGQQPFDKRSSAVLGLTRRVENALRRAGVRAVGQLRLLEDADLLAIPNMGAVAVYQVRHQLSLMVDGDQVAAPVPTTPPGDQGGAGRPPRGPRAKVPSRNLFLRLTDDPGIRQMAETQDLTRIPLEEIGLTSRTLAALVAGRIRTVGDLFQTRRDELLWLPGFGATGWSEVVCSVLELDAKLGATAESDPPEAVEISCSVSADHRDVKPLHSGLSAAAEHLHRVVAGRLMRPSDPRIGTLMQAVGPSAAGPVELALRIITRQQDPDDPGASALRVEALVQAIRGCLSATLEDELHWVVRSVRPPSTPARDRSTEIVVHHLGFDGEGGCVLQQAGQQFGISRERVRQITDSVVKPLAGRPCFAPALDRALAFVAEKAPCVAEQAEAGLASEGIAGAPFRIEGLVTAAQMLGRQVPFEITMFRGTRLIVPHGAGDLPKVISVIATKSVQHWGATTVADVGGQLSSSKGAKVDGAFVSVVLSCLEGFHWLDKASGWFWLSSVARNRIRNVVEQVLSVAGQLDISELREGVRRPHRMRGIAPPRRVLLELCRQMGGFRIEGSIVAADPRLDWGQVLGESEGTLVLILKKYGPVMRRADLEEACLKSGMNRSTFYVRIGYSSVLARYGPGVYGLRGAPVPPGLVDSLAVERKKGRVLQDYGWTSEGMIWLAYEVSQAMINSGVFTIPTGMKRLLQGDFELRTPDGALVGTVVCGGSRGSWGLGPFFRRRGGEPGDHLALVFDLNERTATVSIGDDALFDGLQAREGATEL